MARETYVYDRTKRELVPAHEFYSRKYAGTKRSDLPRPMVIGDNLDDLMNPADGKRYSSKAKYYKAVKAAGCEIAGSDAGRTAAPRKVDDATTDIVNAMRQHGAL